MKVEKDVIFSNIISRDVCVTMMVLLGGGLKTHLAVPLVSRTMFLVCTIVVAERNGWTPPIGKVAS